MSSTYLKKCKQHVFLELVEIHSSMWAVMAWVVIVDLYFRGLFPHYAGSNDPTWLLTGVNVLVMILAVAIYWHVRPTIKQRIMAYFESIATASGLEGAAEGHAQRAGCMG